jgi:DNA-binding NtrC family response regulator
MRVDGQMLGRQGLGQLVGRSAPMREVFETIRRVAASSSRSTVLIEGESGTGKELVARAIHDQSEQHAFPFVSVHCSAIPTELLESELFGHERGAFTGAVRTQRGKFELAGRGTLLLDEVGTLDPRAQVDLLRVLQEREFTRIGGSETIRTHARVIATSNEPLRALVASGRIREDLYYRLRVVRIELPPLRERVDDIGLLAHYFLETHAASSGREVRGFSAAALDAIRRAPWRGNVRELAHAVESAVVVGRRSEIDIEDLPVECFEVGEGEGAPNRSESLNLARRLGALERTLIGLALKESGYNRVRAAKRLGITDRALRYKLRNHGIDAPRSSSWTASGEAARSEP